MFWRITIDDELGIMECRKYGPTIGGRKQAAVGEIYHSHDGQRGSLMRNAGYPSAYLVGLDCSGWWGGSNNGSYTAKATDHFLFQTPDPIDFSDRKLFGGAQNGFRQACGHEGDIRLSSFAPSKQPIPEGGVIPEEPEGIETLASLEREKRPRPRLLRPLRKTGTRHPRRHDLLGPTAGRQGLSRRCHRLRLGP